MTGIHNAKDLRSCQLYSPMLGGLSRCPRPRVPILGRESRLRYLSTSARRLDPKAYSASLLLPKTSLPLKHKNPVAAELSYRKRTTDELYKAQVGKMVRPS